MAFGEGGKVTAMEHHAAAGWPTQVMMPSFMPKGVNKNRGRFRGSGMIGINSWGQTTELHQTGHQQQPRLRSGQIRAADEGRVVQRDKALGVTAPDTNDRQSAMDRSQHQPMPAFETSLP